MAGKLKIDWSEAKGEPVHPVNMFVAQAIPHDHVLTLGFIAPPIVLDSDDQEAMESIPVHIVSRVLLTQAGIRELADILLRNIALREEHEVKK